MLKKIIVFIIKYARTLIYCLYLLSVGLFFPKSRRLLLEMPVFNHKPVKKIKPVLPKVKASEIVRDDICIQIKSILPKDGNVSTFETSIINKLIKQHNPRTIFEIGTFDGLTTFNIAANCSEEARVYTLDLPESKLISTRYPLAADDMAYVSKVISGENFVGTECGKKITQLYGDSATFDFSPFHNTVDFIYVDAAHSYQYVLNDSKMAFKLLRNGKGIIVWHDYGAEWEGVTIALNELYSEDDEYKNIRHIDGTSLALLIFD